MLVLGSYSQLLRLQTEAWAQSVGGGGGAQTGMANMLLERKLTAVSSMPITTTTMNFF